MAPNALEGLCVYHELTNDPILKDILPDMVTSHFKKFCKNPASLTYAYMNLYTAWLDKDDAERKKFLKALSDRENGPKIKRGEHAIKDFSIAHRGLPLAMWYMTDLASQPTPWAGNVALSPLPSTTINCPQSKAPSLDKKVDAQDWKDAASINLVYDPDPGRKLVAPTTIQLKHDMKNIYLRIKAVEPKMNEIVTVIKEDGGPVFSAFLLCRNHKKQEI